jgi:23S rRNA (uracil1939-C5)-methyltransferase
VKKGDLIELNIEKYAFEGKGIARVNKDLIRTAENENQSEEKNKYVVFVNGSYPGDKVKAALKKIKNNYAEAKLKEIILPSDDRVKARCKYFGTCGGCKQQDLEYEAQIKYKQQQVEEIFRKMGAFEDFEMQEILPSDNIFYYRNKMEFSFGDKRWLTSEEINSEEKLERDFAVGLHVPNIYDKILNIDECFLQSELSNEILNFTREFFKQRNTSIYSTHTHEGFLRNLVIRESRNTNDIMVNIVTSKENDSLIRNYSEELLKNFPQVSTIVNNINTKKAAVALGDYEKVFHGDGIIYDKIGKHKFRISSNSFFQTNTNQAEKLYQTAVDFAEFKEDEIVYDLYSGAGTISIFISDKVREVYGFENSEFAVMDAEENKKLNKINNVHFYNADLYKTFLPLVDENKIPQPNIIIVDPPRGGMHKNTIEDVIKLNPKKIVYVSCNPTTQVRDIKMMMESSYKLIMMRPVDMFPHTYHIENVALLTRC